MKKSENDKMNYPGADFKSGIISKNPYSFD
jgi:hypothetical protein